MPIFGLATAHFAAFVVDAGPLIMRVLVDGVLCDGAGVSARGWAWFTNANGLGDVRGAGRTRFCGGSGSSGKEAAQRFELSTVQLYTRALLTSELVGNAREALRRHKR